MKNFKYQLIIFLLLLVLSNTFKGQTRRFIYEVEYKPDSTVQKTKKENYILEINNNKLAYYNRIYYINDSIFRHGGSFGFNGFRLTSFILSDLKKKKYSYYEPLGIHLYKVEDTVDIQWQILPDIVTKNGFSLQRAIAFYGGRNWTAWFAPDIPLPYGPYKFNGLPGLIMQLTDKRGDYVFKLIQSEIVNSDPEVLLNNYTKNAIQLTNENLNRLKIERYENPFKDILNGMLELKDNVSLRLEDGTVLTKKDLKPAEKKERIKIKSFNNPIELNTAVSYPK